jgi:sulfopyruvate decarboxylase TPP-binding subunit
MTAVAHPVAGAVVVDALRAIGTTHVVIVPDTNQRTVLELLDEHDIPVVRAAAEDDVLGICAGLWMAGAKPVAVIQQLGLFAAVNALRGVTHDMGIPLAIVAGLYGRELDRTPEDSSASAVRLCTPLLDALELRWTLVEGPDAAGDIAPALDAAFDEGCTSVVLLGAPTS